MKKEEEKPSQPSSFCLTVSTSSLLISFILLSQ